MNASAAWLSVGALGLSWVVASPSLIDPIHPDPEPQEAEESSLDAPAGRLQRAPARGQSPFGSPSKVEFDREGWRERLQSSDLDSREQSFEELLDLARGAAEESTRATLEEWAAGDDELAWTSRLALRELRNTRGRNLTGSPLFLDHAPFGFFDFRPYGGGSPSGPGGPGGGTDFPALMEALQQHMDAMMNRSRGTIGRPGLSPTPGGGGQARSESQSFQLESGPDGVRVHVQEQVDGDSETKTYEAQSIEELLRLYPELQDRLQIGSLTPGVQFESLFKDLQGGTQGLRPRFLNRGQQQPIPTDILGVYLSAPIESEGDGEVDGVQRGLLVDRIAPGTIAEALGLRRGDLLLELNDVVLESVADVSRVLAERAQDEDVRVTFIDRRGNRRTMTWKPHQ